LEKGHYVKVLMDELFQENNFRNEIIWHYFMGGKSESFSLVNMMSYFLYKI